MNYIIKDGTLVNEGKSFLASVVVSGGKIEKILLPNEKPKPDWERYTIIDAKDKHVLPGVIDEHVHFREPGLTQKADMHTESRAAIAGGITSFMDMPNTVPQTTTLELLEQKFDLAAAKSLANYSFYLGATNDNIGEIKKVDPSRVCGIKIFMGSSTGNMLIDNDRSLEMLFSESPCLIAAHCEDEETIRRNTLHYKTMAERGEIIPNVSIHPNIRTAEACYKSSAKAVGMAEKTGARLHVLHISTAAELSLFRNDIALKDKRITAETCPHYLWFDESSYTDKGFAIKCNPSIKTADDRLAIAEALRGGVIDTIGSDHAPHLRDEKFTADCFTSKSGFPSIQHTLQVVLELGLPIELAVQKMCHNPAMLYGIDKRGFIREGYHADLVIVDTDAHQTISDDKEFSKCGWTPYNGTTFRSEITHTFVNGNLVYENGHFSETHNGIRLTFNR